MINVSKGEATIKELQKGIGNILVFTRNEDEPTGGTQDRRHERAIPILFVNVVGTENWAGEAEKEQWRYVETMYCTLAFAK